MWSSTDSTESTISCGDNYQRPDAIDIFHECCGERKFYKPNEQLDYNWNHNIIQNSCKNQIPSKPLKRKKKHICKSKTSKDALISIWANQNLYNNKQTLDEINKQENVNRKERILIEKNLYIQDHSTMFGSLRNLSDIPYIERTFCYPKIMCHLGFNKPKYSQILHYINSGILLFIIDLRFGSPKRYPKMVKCFDKIRHEAKKKVFGLAFVIHGRRMVVGLLYKNQSIYLDRDSTIILTTDRRFSDRGTHNVIYVNFSNYVNSFEIGDEIDIGNNEIILTVEGKSMNSVICIVKKDGLLKKHMSVKIPFNRYIYPPPIITKEEDDDVAFAISMGCDYLITTCVTENLRSHIDWALAIKNRLIIILQKISFTETPKVKTIDEIDEMFKVCDGFYVYGEATPETNYLQEYVMTTAIRKQKMMVQAGFMMKKQYGRPDKETLKHYLLYPDCIAVSPLIYDVTRIRSIIRHIYPEMNRDNFILSLSPLRQQHKSVESEFCRQINLLSICEKVSCIIVVNNSGHFVRLLAENRPLIPIIASFLDSPYARHCLHSRNVYVTLFRDSKPPTWIEELTIRLRGCIEYGKIMNFIQKDVPFIFCYNSHTGLKYCNTARILLNVL